jgi:transposase
MSMSSDVHSIVAWVGLDWADKRHELRLLPAGATQSEALQLEQKPEALQNWVADLRRRFPQGHIAVALEQSRGPLLYALMNYDFLVLYPVPPKSLAKYREAFHQSGSKSDPGDADLLLDMVRSHRDRLHAWLPDDPLTRQLRLMVEYRRKLVGDRIQITNRLTALLKHYFPQALEWAGPLEKPFVCEFLRRWPSLPDLQKASAFELREFDQTHGVRRSPTLADRFEEIQAALPLTRDTAITQASVLMAQTSVDHLRILLSSIEHFNQVIQALFKEHPDHNLFYCLPGAGDVLAPRLLVAFGSDRTRYQDSDEVERFTGIAPVVERSGKACWIHSRMACPKFLRQTFHEFSAYSRFWSPWAQAYYQQARSRGVGHHAAVRSLAFKWIRILYRCWKSRALYDEAFYQRALLRRGSPLAHSVGLYPVRNDGGKG